MKYLRYLLFAVLLILPLSVNALEAKPVINCDKSILSNNQSANCTLKLEITSGSVKRFVGDLEATTNLQISNITPLEGITNNGNGNSIDVSFEETRAETVNLATFTVIANNVEPGTTESITLKSIQLTDEIGEIQEYLSISNSLKVPSDNALLSSITVNVGTLSPVFNPEINEYSVTVEVDEIEITASGNANARISGTGVKKLNYGTNTFQIIVTAEAGNVKTYIITVNRENNKSNDSSLKSLIVNGATLEFDSNIKEYKGIILPSNIDTFTVTAIANDSKASIKYSSNNVELELDQTDTIYIYVTAEDGSISTYRVTATRKDDRSSNNNLKTLTMNGKNVNIGSGQSFTTTVDNSVTTAKVEAFAQDEKSSVKINGNSNLKVGNNVFEIVVTAENEAIKTYRLTVIRKNSDGDITNLSNNSNLKKLEIKDVEFKFDKTKLQYDFEIENEVKKLEIKYELEDNKASATLEGNDNLKVGLNIIKIMVTAQNGESSTYVLNVTRKEKNNVVENDTTTIINALKDKEKYEEVIVKVNSSDNLLIPNNVINNIVDSKKKITYKIIGNNNILYSVVLNGNSFNNYTKDFNYGLTFKSDNSAFIEKIGARKNLILSFKQQGEIPTGTMYNIYVGSTFSDNSSLYLYSYNSENDELLLKQENLKVDGGYVNIIFNDIEEYVLLNSKVINEPVIGDKQDNINNDDDNVENSNDVNWLMYTIIGFAILLLVVLVIIFINRNKKNGKKLTKKENNVSLEKKDLISDISIPEPIGINSVNSTSSVKNENLSDINITDSINNIPINNIDEEIDLIDIDISQPITSNNDYLLGISVMDIDAYLKKCPLANLKNSNIKDGIVIVGFDINSSIQKAGIIQGDVLLDINNQKILNKEHFKGLISNVNHGMEVTFSYYRNGEIKQIKVML